MKKSKPLRMAVPCWLCKHRFLEGCKEPCNICPDVSFKYFIFDEDKE